ncbi:hypothetical protein HDU91_000379 [Kappamyces sp. JEL0680]|nr:hypothetical protein HDU91_000379 [Kappamyces sp. JEL0680]
MPAADSPPPPYSLMVNYTESPTHPTHFEAPPVYMDMSIIPRQMVLLAGQAPPLDRPTVVTTTQSEAQGIYTFDPRLDQDKDELWRFMMCNLSNPRKVVRCAGTHTETRHHTSVDKDGNTHHHTDQVTVTDFEFSLDLSGYIAGWSQIACEATNGHPQKSFNDTLEEYCQSTNKLKEIHLKKQVQWEWDKIRDILVFCIRQSGYGHSISITFPSYNDHIDVFCSSAWSRFSHNTAVRVLCVLTCLCIVFYPMFLGMRDKATNRIVVNYPVLISPEEFYNRNYYTIVHHVTSRTKAYGNNVIVAL